MTESNVALAERPPEQIDADSASGGSDRRKLFVLVGGGAAVVLLGLAAWFLFFSGSGASTEEDGLVAAAPRPAASAPAPKASAAPAPAATPFTEAIGRDPFEPLIEPAAAVAPEEVAAPGTGTTPGGTTSGGVSVSVEMVSVTPTDATLKVDGKSYTAKVGEVFASNFKVYGLFDAQCAGVLYGDQSVPLCVGDVRTLTS